MQPDHTLVELSNSSVSEKQEQIDSLALLLHRMTNHIRRSLELPEILAAAVAEVQAFLGTDRVKVYRFHEDGSGEVVSEVIQDQRLPSLLGHNFPAADIPEEAREQFLRIRQRSIVDVAAEQIRTSPLDSEGVGETLDRDVQVRPVDPCHVDYLTAMGVRSSLVVPILDRVLDRDRLWGLLVSHHSETHRITEQELQIVQLVADELSIAIAQSNLLNQARQHASQEATINQIATLLHSTPEMHLQTALEQTVLALKGFGGRVYIAPQHVPHLPQLFTCGNQPAMQADNGRRMRDERETRGGATERLGDQTINSEIPTSSFIPHPSSFPFLPIEQHPDWEAWLEMEDAITTDESMWAIADVYQAEMPSDLSAAFLAAHVRSLLIICLKYRQQILGYLSIFRHEIDVERIWAGEINWDDPRQLRPRLSFETWRELKQGQADPWTTADIDLARALGEHFAIAIHQNALYQQVWSLNADLKRDIQKRKQGELKISTLNAELEQRVLERTTELKRTNQELRRQITERELALQERQQAEASLERLSHQNELILNSAGEGIYGLNVLGKITFANPAAARMLGYTVEELIGLWMTTLLNHSKPDGTPHLLTESPIYATLRDGTVQHRTEDVFWRQDGTSFPVEYVSSPIREQDRIVGAVVLFKDITERQHVERMKDEFVSIVSHELRTPLTSIRSTLGLLASGWLNSHPEKSQRMLEIAFSNTNRLVRLINDTLDVERIKFGKIAMEKQSCNAADLMIQSADAMRAMAEKAGIKLSVKPVSVTFWVDPDRIIQTFTNLLNNAIKFSPANTTVWLTAELGTREQELGARDESISSPQLLAPSPSPSSPHPLSPIPSYILFCVKDQGCGIPEDKLETIFDRFQQVDTSNSRGQGGTGLGLTICRGIVQEHGGQIWVESKLGDGSAFCFTIPLTESGEMKEEE
ncbi:MAG: GAF domain-containing protein [Leptolyngbyaceae cyanobacterium RU_5_1]|nr:GAF domain-containing protein [Leptolyngbyaceae cyanobacterium RU_5_1]